MSSSVFSRRTASLLLGVCAATVAVRTTGAQERVDVATIERIKAEEMNNSQVMEIMSWLSDVYGPRLTWSPNIIRARDWAMGEMTKWGLANVHAETWDTPAGLGWQNQKFSFMATSPVPFIVEAVPQAWSGSTNGTATGKAMLVEAGCFDELKEKYAGKLKGAFIMTMPPRNEPVNAFVPTARRYTDSALAVMAAAQPAPDGGRGGGGRGGRGAGPQRSATCQKQAERDSLAALARGGRGGRGGFGGGGGLNVTDTATVSWLRQQGISAILLGDVSHVGGDIGTNNGASRAASAPRVPAVHVAQESYGRIARMVQKNVPVTLELNVQNTFYAENTTSFNIIGEIPGTDAQLKDEVVMIGAHFDSWHSGTGATDNGAGSGVMLEAMRLLKSLGLKPRRTIRIGLWTGEEQGLLGSAAYVRQHFGVLDSSWLPSDAGAEEVRRVLQRRQRQRQDPRRLPPGHRGRASGLRCVDGSVQEHGDEDADDQQHWRHGSSLVHRRRLAGLPVHSGSTRLRQRHASHEPGCVRALAARRHEVQRGGRRQLRVAGGAARREVATAAGADGRTRTWRGALSSAHGLSHIQE